MKRGDLAGLQLIADEDRQQRAATILVDVAYIIDAHFVLTSKADDTEAEGKHLDIFNRRAARGQCFHQPCLGTREFDARFELITPETALPAPINETRDLGFMLWDIDFAAPGKPSLFYRAKMENGVIRVPPPGSPEVLR